MKSKRLLILALILLVGLFFRVVDLNGSPKAMYGDGLTLVYDAYSIAKTGNDQKGNHLPVIFSLGGGRPGGYIYATTPFAYFLGPTTLAANLISILSGLGIMVLIYLYGGLIFNETVGLIGAAIVAISPWDIAMSRGPFETHFALFLGLFGVYCFFRAKENFNWYILSSLSFALSVQTYSTYILTIPLIILALLISWKRYKQIFSNFLKPQVIISILIFAFSLGLVVVGNFNKGNEARFSIVNVFNDPATRYTIGQKIRSEKDYDSLDNQKLKSYLHNPYVEYAGLIEDNYVRNFFPNFLFTHGDGNPRHNPAGIGEVYWIDAIFILFGILALYKDKKGLLAFLGAWIFITPLATSLVGGPHALRDSFMLPPLVILSAIGAYSLWSKRSFKLKNAIFIFLGVALFIEGVFFIDRLYFTSPKQFASFWSYDTKHAVQIALANQQKFKFVFLSSSIDNMEFAYPVYASLDPNLVIAQNRNNTDLQGYKFLNYGNVYIGSVPAGNLKEFFSKLPGPVLYIGKTDDGKYINVNGTVRDFNDQPVLIISEKVDKGSPPSVVR